MLILGAFGKNWSLIAKQKFGILGALKSRVIGWSVRRRVTKYHAVIKPNQYCCNRRAGYQNYCIEVAKDMKA